MAMFKEVADIKTADMLEVACAGSTLPQCCGQAVGNAEERWLLPLRNEPRKSVAAV